MRPLLLALTASVSLALLGCDKNSAEAKDASLDELQRMLDDDSGDKAVAALETLSKQVCDCGDDEECLDAAEESANDFVERYADAQGGDQQRIEDAMMKMTKCDPTFTLAFARRLE